MDPGAHEPGSGGASSTAGSSSSGEPGGNASTGGVTGGSAGSTTVDVDAGAQPLLPNNGVDAGVVVSTGIDVTLSEEIANPDLVPTTLDEGVVLSEESYAVADVMEPAFKVVTPSASYWLLKRAGAIVKAVDTLVDGSGDWIAQSSQAISRGLPSLGSCCEVGSPDLADLPVMTTVEDESKRSNDRVRLISESEDGAWRLRWDFFLTHVTLRIERAAKPFNFTYRGVPGAELNSGDPGDRLVTPTGAIYGTEVGMEQDILAYEAGGELAERWDGPVEWTYFFDVVTKHSLFLIQHHDDAAIDRYQVLGDTAVMRFGTQPAGDEPRTFSFGFVGDNVHQLVVEQVERAVAIDP
jgi:hypothetical protein